MSIYDSIIEKIKSIDTTNLKDDASQTPTSKIIEEQRVYFWIRLYLKDENSNVQIGDDIQIKWTPSGETLDTKFIYYSKRGIMKDHDDEIVNYTGEDDKKVLCLMVDERVVNFGADIPFIRTLFKTSIHYEYQVIRRGELQFINVRTGEVLDYFDVDF